MDESLFIFINWRNFGVIFAYKTAQICAKSQKISTFYLGALQIRSRYLIWGVLCICKYLRISLTPM